MNRAWATLTQKPRARHAREVSDALTHLLDDLAHPDMVGGVHVGEGVDVVARASLEGHLPQVEAVVDPVVGERCEVLLIDRFPDSKLGCDPSIEEVLYGEAVRAFRSRSETEQLARA